MNGTKQINCTSLRLRLSARGNIWQTRTSDTAHLIAWALRSAGGCETMRPMAKCDINWMRDAHYNCTDRNRIAAARHSILNRNRIFPCRDHEKKCVHLKSIQSQSTETIKISNDFIIFVIDVRIHILRGERTKPIKIQLLVSMVDYAVVCGRIIIYERKYFQL